MTDPSSIHAWLVDRIRARLALAQAAGGDEWSQFRYVVYVGPPHPNGLTTRGDVCSMLPGQEDLAAHIAANDPARIIADCEAALRIMARHRPTTVQGRVTCDESWPVHNPDWPCPDVLDLAAPYTTDPDCPQELRRG